MNQAIQFLHQAQTPAEVVTRLAARLGVSTRQAVRYVRVAQQQSSPLPVPEVKAVFTVKLPKTLIGQVRGQARAQGQSISQWVAKALEEHLRGRNRHG